MLSQKHTSVGVHTFSSRQVCNCRSVPARAVSSITHIQHHEDKVKAASELQLYNTMGRHKQTFRPRQGQDEHVSMYVCGVTVYDWYA